MLQKLYQTCVRFSNVQYWKLLIIFVFSRYMLLTYLSIACSVEYHFLLSFFTGINKYLLYEMPIERLKIAKPKKY